MSAFRKDFERADRQMAYELILRHTLLSNVPHTMDLTDFYFIFGVALLLHRDQASQMQCLFPVKVIESH